MIFIVDLNRDLNQWFKSFDLNRANPVRLMQDLLLLKQAMNVQLYYIAVAWVYWFAQHTWLHDWFLVWPMKSKELDSFALDVKHITCSRLRFVQCLVTCWELKIDWMGKAMDFYIVVKPGKTHYTRVNLTSGYVWPSNWEGEKADRSARWWYSFIINRQTD